MDKKPRVFGMSFGSVYPLYVQKAEKKGRTKEEVDEIITWLTGYSGEPLQRVIDAKVDLETFFAQAPLTVSAWCGLQAHRAPDGRGRGTPLPHEPARARAHLCPVPRPPGPADRGRAGR